MHEAVLAMIARPGKAWIAFTWMWLMICLVMALLGTSSAHEPTASNLIAFLIFAVLPPSFLLWIKTLWVFWKNR